MAEHKTNQAVQTDTTCSLTGSRYTGESNLEHIRWGVTDNCVNLLRTHETAIAQSAFTTSIAINYQLIKDVIKNINGDGIIATSRNKTVRIDIRRNGDVLQVSKGADCDEPIKPITALDYWELPVKYVYSLAADIRRYQSDRIGRGD